MSAYEGVAAPLTNGEIRGALLSVPQPSPYHDLNSTEELPMANKVELVSWHQFATLIAVMIVVIGGALVWLRTDLSNINSTLTNEMSDLTRQVSGVREGVAVTNQKLDDLIRETQRNGSRSH
jgi:hypothetical protein